MRIPAENGVQRRCAEHRFAPGLDVGFGGGGQSLGHLGGQGAEAAFEQAGQQPAFAFQAALLHSLTGDFVKPGVDTFGKHGVGLQKVVDRFDVVNVRRARLAPQQALDPDDEGVAEAGVGRVVQERVEGPNDLTQVFRRAAVFEAEEGLDGGSATFFL